MAKKKKNKKLRKLAKVLGAGLAIAGLGKAFANRKRDASIADNEAKEAGFDIPLVKGTPEENTFKVQDVKVNVPSESVNLGRMTGSGPNSGLTGQEIRANYAQKMRNAVTGVDGPPSILNPYRNRVQVGRGNFMAKGGRVGVGKAKRGFGRAMKKGGKK